MRHAMKSSAALAIAALLWSAAAPAEAKAPGKSGEPHGKSGEPHGKSGEPHGKSGEPHGKSGEPHGKSDEAHARAPGQNKEDKSDEEAKAAGAPGQDEAKARERAQTRAKRRQDRRNELKREHGVEVLQRPPVIAELKTHAWRMARLERMHDLAEDIANADKRKKTLARLEKLVTREKERHARQMEHLKTEGGTVAASARAEGAAKPETPKKAGGGQ
jgi:hypothetical protein